MANGNREDLADIIDKLGDIKAQRKALEEVEQELVAAVRERMDPGETVRGKRWQVTRIAVEQSRLDGHKLVAEFGEAFIAKFKSLVQFERIDCKPYKAPDGRTARAVAKVLEPKAADL